MGAGFIRRFIGREPTVDEVLAIEGVVLVDRDPPAAINGANTGVVTLVAEFEDGAFETPTEILSGGDLATTFGSFGYAYDGVPGGNPCARARRADGATNPEYWNGNGFIALVNKRFAGLICVRVDTSVGEVSFTRQASLSGRTDFSFALEDGQTLVFDFGGSASTATFNGAAATTTSGAGTYPSTFVGGEKIVVKIEDVEHTIVFLAVDQTQAQVIARMNATVGYVAFADAGSGETSFTGRIKGTSGAIQIVSLDALVATATGFAAGAAIAGTGNVPNLAAVKTEDANTVVTAADADARIDRNVNGAIRITNVATPGTGTIEVRSTSTAVAFGFPLDTEASAATGVAGVIPAGTVVKTSGNVEFVTMQSVAVTASNAGPYKVRVRHALDDGTGAGVAVSTVTLVPSAIAAGAFAVTNDLAIGAAMTELQIDNAYVTAIAKTKSIKSAVKRTNIIVSARQSNTIRAALRANQLEASQEGCFGRITCIRPPIGTSRAVARSTNAQPGVGAYRRRGVVYCFPGVRTLVPQIALRGLAGGAGFTADGVINTGFDMWVTSVLSQLPPEEDAGQETGYLDGVIDLEDNADTADLTIADYIAFKAAGIAAPRIDDGVCIIQSAVTSVDPAADPAGVPIARTRFTFFLQDTMAPRLNAYSKKLATNDRRAAIVSEIEGFSDTLLSTDQPQLQRIAAYETDTQSSNTPALLERGLFTIDWRVKMLPPFRAIVLRTEVGETVQILDPTAT
jgi:carbon monoxide dehydrogenase subunit G